MNFDIGKGRHIMVSPEATCEIVIGLAFTMALVADAVLMCGIPGCSVIEPHWPFRGTILRYVSNAALSAGGAIVGGLHAVRRNHAT